MADIDLKTETPDTSLPATGFLFGADSQSAASPSVYSTQAVATALLGSTSLTGATVTADSPVLNLAQTWNNSGVTFTGLKFTATDTAAGVLSRLLSVGTTAGGEQAGIVKDGHYFGKGLWVSAARSFNGSNYFGMDLSVADSFIFYMAGTSQLFANSNGLNVGNAACYGFSKNAAAAIGINADVDVRLTRRAAANLRLGAADAAGSAIAISSVASNQLTLASNHGLTTGAAIIITGTAAPSGTSLNTRYYARVIAAAVIELYSTYDQATATSGTTGIISVTTAGTSASVRLATPFQSFGVQDFTGTDIPGQPFIIRGSRGTGTGPGGDIVFQVAPAGTAGSSQNALATAFQVNGNGGVTGQDGATANTLALRNGANAQFLRVYSTYTDASNYERGAINTGADFVELAAETAGTGDDNLDVRLTPAGTGNVRFGTHTGTADTAVSGYIEIKDAGGTIRKLAVIT